tara:strand:+ start:288 stop:425 length:138 start_codon:yes stop_codon:yes gene_type:complete
MKVKEEKENKKKLEGFVVDTNSNRELIKKNLLEMLKKQGIEVKKD